MTGGGPLLSPEEDEYQKKLTELAEAEALAVAAEERLQELRTALAAFEEEYLQALGPCFAQMEELREASAGKQEEGEEALRCATALQRDDCPPGELKLLFREVAKSVHPDLAPTEQERQRRGELMAHANAAYAGGDPERLRGMLQRWKADADAVAGEGIAFDLVRVLRRLAAAGLRADQARKELRELRKTDLNFLRQQAERATAEGRDLLAEMRANLERQVAQQRARVARMR